MTKLKRMVGRRARLVGTGLIGVLIIVAPAPADEFQGRTPLDQLFQEIGTLIERQEDDTEAFAEEMTALDARADSLQRVMSSSNDPIAVDMARADLLNVDARMSALESDYASVSVERNREFMEKLLDAHGIIGGELARVFDAGDTGVGLDVKRQKLVRHGALLATAVARTVGSDPQAQRLLVSIKRNLERLKSGQVGGRSEAAYAGYRRLHGELKQLLHRAADVVTDGRFRVEDAGGRLVLIESMALASETAAGIRKFEKILDKIEAMDAFGAWDRIWEADRVGAEQAEEGAYVYDTDKIVSELESILLEED